MFFYLVITPISTTSVFEVPAIRVNTTKSTYTFTSVSLMKKRPLLLPQENLADFGVGEQQRRRPACADQHLCYSFLESFISTLATGKISFF